MMRTVSLTLVLVLLTSSGGSADDGPAHDGRSIASWVEQMCEEDVGRAIDAQTALLGAGGTAVPALVELLTDEDPYHRHLAVHTLALLGVDAVEAREALVTTLENDAPPMRMLAAEALGRMGPAAEDTLEVFQPFLDHQAPYPALVADIATRGIEEVPPFEAAEDPEVEGLRVSQWAWRLVCPHRSLRKQAAEVLAAQPKEVVLPWMLRWLFREAALIGRTEPQWQGLSRRMPSEAAAGLELVDAVTAKALVERAAELDEPDFDRAVIRLFWESSVDVTPVFDALVDRIENTTGQTQWVAIELLRDASEPRPTAIPFLVAALDDAGVGLSHAAQILGRLQGEARDALPLLARLQAEADGERMSWAADDVTLAIRRIQAGDEALVDGYAGESTCVRRALLRTLRSERTPPGRRDALIVEALEDEEQLNRRKACEWLLDLGSEGETRLLELAKVARLRADVLAVVASHLRLASGEFSDDSLAAMLGIEDEDEDEEEPRDLSAFLPLAVQALAGEHRERDAGLELAIGLGPAARELLPRLRAILESDDWLNHREAATALGAVTANTPDAVEDLIALLADENSLTAIGAAKGLGRVGRPALGTVSAILDRLRAHAESEEGQKEEEFPCYETRGFAKSLRSLAHCGDEAVATLVEAYGNECRDVRWASVHALASVAVASDEALEILEKAIGDVEDEVAIESVSQLMRITQVALAKWKPSQCAYDQLDPFYRLVGLEYARRAQSNAVAQILEQAGSDAGERTRRILQEGVRRANPLADFTDR